MEKTLLESTVEEIGIKLGLPLLERKYAEDLDSDAELDDFSTPIKCGSDGKGSIYLGRIMGITSHEQVYYKEQPLFRRQSGSGNCFGIEYELYADNRNSYGSDGLSARRNSDRIISSNTISDESFHLYFTPNLKKPRVLPARYNIYDSFPILSLVLFNNGEIGLEPFDLLDFEEDKKLIYATGYVESLKEYWSSQTFDKKRSEQLIEIVHKLHKKLGGK